MILYIAIFSLLSFIFSFFGCKYAIDILSKKKIFDIPIERSLHKKPIPIGAGIVILFIAIFYISSLMFYQYFNINKIDFSNLLILLSISVLGFLSWKDDLKRLSVFFRIIVHLFAVIIGINSLSSFGNIFHGIFPVYIDTIVTIILWVWIINLTNFMDGIDGITGAEGFFIFLGAIILLSLITNSLDIEKKFYTVLFLSVLLGSLVGFLIWNWHPAKIFLGDVGSIPIGFIFGWVVFELSNYGLWHVSILLPMYYFLDASITLIYRIIKKEKIFIAHKTHFYQKATKNLKHSTIVISISLLNILLIGLSIFGLVNPDMRNVYISLGIFFTLITIYIFHKAFERKY